MRNGNRFLRLFALELAVYAVFLAVYLHWVLRLFHAHLAHFQQHHRVGYAFVALGLIVVQGIGLEMLTTLLIRRISALIR